MVGWALLSSFLPWQDIHGRALVRLTAALLERMNITDPKDQQAILNEVVRLVNKPLFLQFDAI